MSVIQDWSRDVPVRISPLKVLRKASRDDFPRTCSDLGQFVLVLVASPEVTPKKMKGILLGTDTLVFRKSRQKPRQKRDLKAYEALLQRIPIDDRGTPYKFNVKCLAWHRDLSHSNIRTPTSDWRQAVKALRKWNDPRTPLGKNQMAALKRLQALGKLEKWGASILMKCFLDLDQLFFRGTLWGNVAIMFEVRPCAEYAGCTRSKDCPGNNRVVISLNTPYIVRRDCSVHLSFGTTIHEMMLVQSFLLNQLSLTILTQELSAMHT